MLVLLLLAYHHAIGLLARWRCAYTDHLLSLQEKEVVRAEEEAADEDEAQDQDQLAPVFAASAVPRFSGKGLAAGRVPQRGRDSTVRGLAFEPQNAVLNFGIRVCEGAGSDSEDGFDPEEEVPSTG